MVSKALLYFSADKLRLIGKLTHWPSMELYVVFLLEAVKVSILCHWCKSHFASNYDTAPPVQSPCLLFQLLQLTPFSHHLYLNSPNFGTFTTREQNADEFSTSSICKVCYVDSRTVYVLLSMNMEAWQRDCNDE